MNKLETKKAIYKGTLKDGILYENYLFSNGKVFYISDMFVNASNPRSAYNKVAKKLGLPLYNKEHEEDFQNEVECGYIQIEEANYYDEETDTHFKYYVSTIYPKEEETK